MNADIMAGSAAEAQNRLKIRNPARVNLRKEASRLEVEAASGSGVAIYLEAFWLGCLISAVAGVLPLVMYLHR